MDKALSITANDVINNKFTFETIDHLESFFSTEYDYWSEKNQELSHQRDVHTFVASATSHLQQICGSIKRLKANLESWNDDELSNFCYEFQNQDLSRLQQHWIYCNDKIADSFFSCHLKHGHRSADFFFKVVTGKLGYSPSGIVEILGVIEAYDFLKPGASTTNREDSEATSLDRIRQSYIKNEQKIHSDHAIFTSKMEGWSTKTKENWQTWWDATENKWNDACAEHNNNFSVFLDECKTSAKDLESRFQEKLRLSKPADYWNKAASKYRRQGWGAFILLSLVVVAGLINFQDFFVHWLKGQEQTLKLTSLQGIVIFATILTMYAFAIKTLSKLTFSSFHLMRDAEEREQLTYLYLSLIDEGAIDDSARDIILQSLFSRTETGLLASESGPTMPGIADLMKAATSK